MAQFKPLQSIRPAQGLAGRVSCLPYDVMDREEAGEMAKGNPFSFLHVTRSEIDLPDGVDAYDPRVYDKAAENLESMLKNGTLVRDASPKYYIYRQVMQGRSQTGFVGCPAVEDYRSGVIKRHELTRVEKETDRVNHFDRIGAHDEPVFLTYRENGVLRGITEAWIAGHAPLYDFTSEDGISHAVWDIDDGETNRAVEREFAATDSLYIADGHHRSASSVRVGLDRRGKNPGYTGGEAFNFFLAVAFPDKDLRILDYNRLVRDLNGMDAEAFLSRVREKFTVDASDAQVKPSEKHTFGMLLEGRWYRLWAKQDTYDGSDAIGRLDVSILQNNLLGPILGIGDPRTDKRIDFVGGIRGLNELERRTGLDMKAAFSMYPTTMDDLLGVADAGLIMPPKSTWFEPKLRSGLFVHSFR